MNGGVQHDRSHEDCVINHKSRNHQAAISDVQSWTPVLPSVALTVCKTYSSTTEEEFSPLWSHNTPLLGVPSMPAEVFVSLHWILDWALGLGSLSFKSVLQVVLHFPGNCLHTVHRASALTGCFPEDTLTCGRCRNCVYN